MTELSEVGRLTVRGNMLDQIREYHLVKGLDLALYVAQYLLEREIRIDLGRLGGLLGEW
ncbi:hypothetical protein [Caballeronia sp. LZ034LL]|uniref:hypothetical protein n=1 Tax=Caballeronia sp. LZ034LL TaxID=3038567 RepID=UPI0028614BD8|nr:hypothetical protein [Caballeronia sp. LZ034LL]MDR5839355.1 hypothetical protein [Caballeronia sp. LZ034LL]